MDLALHFPRFVPALFGQFGFSAPELALQAVRDQVDRLVEVMPVIFCMEIPAGEREMDFDYEGLLADGSLWRIMLDADMGSDDSILVALEFL